MAFEIGPYQVGDRLYQGRDLSVYRAIRLSDGLPLIAKIPNTNRPESAVTERLNNEFRILQRLQHAGHCRRAHATEPYGASVGLSLRTPTGPVSQNIFRSCSFRSRNSCAWPSR